MVDVPAGGAGPPAGDWIHRTLQAPSGGLRTDTGALRDRLSPGFSLQASLCWLDLGQGYGDDAWRWIEESGLRQEFPDANGTGGGFVDWKETSGLRAPWWQRFIDTSFYAIAVWSGGYDFTMGCRPFVRADATGDRGIDISDAVRIVGHLFLGGTVDCEKAADANDDGVVDVSDAIYTVSFLFLGGPAPPHPYPRRGVDLTEDSLSCSR